MNIYYGGGNCRLDVSSKILGLQIDYRGRIEIQSKLLDGWVIGANNHKIICISLIGATNLIDLFEYSGEFKIKSCKIVTETRELMPITSKIENSTRFMDLVGEIDGLTTEINNMDKTLKVGRMPLKTTVKGKGAIETNKTNNLSKETIRGKYGI